MARSWIVGLGALAFLLAAAGAGYYMYQKQQRWTIFDASRVAYAEEAPIAVLHEVVGNAHYYSGNLILTDCDTTAASLQSTEPPLTVSLRISIYRADSGCKPEEHEPFNQPFFAEIKVASGTEPVFAGVFINDVSAAFTLREHGE